jgi:hypothetical protein
MKSMITSKSTLKTVLVLCMSVFVLASCSKYDEGPAVSLRTKKARLCNSWQISSAYQNGADKTAEFNTVLAGYLLNIKKDDTYTLSYSPLSAGTVTDNGSWKFNDDKTHVIFTDSDGESSDYTILRLKEKELWVKFMEDGDEWEAHLVPKN